MQKLKVETILNSDIQNVLDKWINIESVKVWCHAGADWGVGNVENDVRVGGRFLTNMHALDNSASFDFTGEYTEVELLENKNGKYTARLKYKMDKLDSEAMNRECEVLFESVEGENMSGGSEASATKVTEIFDSENLNSIELQISGWQSILDNFKKYVEDLK